MANVNHNCNSSSCQRVDDEFMVSCDKCKRWWHYDCHQFDADKFDTVTPWFCEETDCVFRADEELSEAGGLNLAEDQVDSIIEAAAVAQATVAQRDKELSELRSELEAVKRKLSSSISRQQPVASPRLPTGQGISRPNEKLEIIKKIQENHKALLSGKVSHAQSTPLQHRPSLDKNDTAAAIRETDMEDLLTILNRSNVQELPNFSGDNKREWPYFEEVFKSTTVEGKYSNKGNVARLRKALKGEAYQLVSDRLKYSSDADAIMDLLRTMFGRYDVLVHDLTSDLLCLPRLNSKCDPKIRSWAVKLNGFVADVKSMNREEDLTNGYVLTNLASRLDPGLYQEWQRRRSGFSRTNLQHFADFVTEKVVNLPPELMKSGSAADSKKSQLVGGTKASRVLVHQPVSSTSSSDLCCKCKKGHHALISCKEFLDFSPVERQTFAKVNSICFSCLIPSRHEWKVCSRKRVCGTNGCVRRHHPLLHFASDVNNNTDLNKAAAPFVPQQLVHSSHLGANVAIMFKVVPIRIFGSDKGIFVDTYAFLDDGSSLSMIEEDLFYELGLEGKREQLTLQWTKGMSRQENSFCTSLSVSAVNSRKQHMLKNVYTIKDLGLASQSIDVAYLKSLYPHLRGLPLSDLVDAKPKILLGLDQAKFMLGHGRRHGKDDGPHALKTLLGWVVFGKAAPSMHVSCLHRTLKPTMQLMFHDAIKKEDDLHELVKRHFTTEEFGVMPPKGDLVSREVSRSIDIMERSLKLEGRQYEIGLLWDADDVKLPDSYPMALKRLVGLEKSLRKKPHLLEWKNNYMRELVSKGYARVASQEELQKKWPRVWYAPTFIVVNPNKVPPKPRCVCDVAAKVNGVSLNTHLMKGPDNLVPLHAGLFKFRERKIAVNADVKEMFHRIRIKEEDQQCQRILWRDGDSSRQPVTYIMQVMMFGPRCSPTCAQFIKNHHANLFMNECPVAVDGLTKRTYVDDYFNSHNSIEDAISVTRDAIRICHSMNFDLVGVQSNSRELLLQMPESHVNSKLVSIDPNECESMVSKVLGMYWHPALDHFTYKLSVDEDMKNMLADAVISKRLMLKTIMKIFDPLGLISLFIIRGRILLQEVWREGFDWDEAVSSELRDSWLDFLKELKNIEQIKIPRRYVSWNPDDSFVSLLIFVDASEKAFAAVAYLRFNCNDKVEVVQVMAKAKVAPVKQLSIPRLELQAAVLGVRLATTIRESHTIRIDEVIFLSDSKTVLSWINSAEYKFPAFVSTRIGEILDSTSPRQWYHIGSKDNVADDGTKWFDVPMGNQDSRWFRGPDFLKLPVSEWPITASKAAMLVKSNMLIHVRGKGTMYGAYEMLSARFQARWSSSVRVVALLLRFKDILRKKPAEKKTFVTPFEFAQAENWIFRKIQEDVFSSEVSALKSGRKVCPSSSILSLSPFVDEDGTLRMSSRAQKANTSYASRNPAILPKNHPLVDLLIKYHHENNFHMGTATVISDIRERAWVISIRGAVERVRSRCNMCKRLKAKPVMPLMGQLPEARLAFGCKPFTHVGVDCFGPLLVKFGRGTVKRYGMIFTCLSFRAVQIELLNDLSLDQCAMAVRRFVINRVVTRFFYSDNGLNFVGTKNMFEKDAKEMENLLGEYSSKFEGILWRFIPAYSPWMGGAWERLIQSIKKSVDFVLRGVVPREEVLRNALLEAQGQINRRPLTHIPVDPEDPKPLTPNSMLFGEDDRDTTAPGVFSERDGCSRLFSRQAQHFMAQLTSRWYTEYLPTITRRSKWFKETKQPEVDNIVIMFEPNEIRKTWQLGRVVKVYPGKDGTVRMADVKLPNGSIKLKRSVGRLAVLDLQSST